MKIIQDMGVDSPGGKDPHLKLEITSLIHNENVEVLGITLGSSDWHKLFCWVSISEGHVVSELP